MINDLIRELRALDYSDHGQTEDLLAVSERDLRAIVERLLAPTPKLSPQMWRMLEDVRDGFGTHGTVWGRSQQGGRYGTAHALIRRGLLAAGELTPAAVALLEQRKAAK